MHEIEKNLQSLTKILADIHAIDLITIDIRGQTTVSDYMIICTARSSRHVRAMAQHVLMEMKLLGIEPLNNSQLESADWALLDYGDFIINIMQAETRAYYNLEGLWLSQDQNNHHVKNNAH